MFGQLKFSLVKSVSLSLIAFSGVVLSTPACFADATSLLIKPPPRGWLGEEAGRSIARSGNDTLLGSYILGDERHADSGGAFLFEGDSQTPSKTYSLPSSVEIHKFSETGFGEHCVISNTNGAELGDRVSMSEKWVAVATNGLGAQRSAADYDGTCNEVIPTVFLTKRGNSVLDSHHVALPSNERIKGIAVGEKDLAIVTDRFTYMYSFNGFVWLYNSVVSTGQNPASGSFHSPIDIDGKYAVGGYPSSYGLVLFEKSGLDWQVADFVFPRDDNYAKSVSIDGNSVVVGSDNSLEFWEIETDGSGNVDLVLVDSFAVGGDYIQAAISENIAVVQQDDNSVPLNIYRKNNNHWFLSSDSVDQQDVLGLPHPTQPFETVAYSNAGWAADQIDIAGGVLAAGWKGFSVTPHTGTPSSESLNGSVVLHDVNAAFGTSHMLDDAENPEPKWLSNGDHLWTRKSGGTSSWGTGPSSGAGGSGHYYYVETSSGYAFQSGDVATLESDYLDPSDVVLSFDLHRYGSDQGLLQIEYQVFGEDDWHWAGWSVSGEEGNYWLSDSHDLRQESAIQAHDKIKLRFKYTASGGYRGDIAIDNIRISRF